MAVLSIPSCEAPLTPEDDEATPEEVAEAAKAENVVDVEEAAPVTDTSLAAG